MSSLIQLCCVHCRQLVQNSGYWAHWQIVAEFITVSAFCLHIHPNSACSTSGLDYLGCHDITLGFTSLWLADSMWQVHRGKPCLLSELQVSWEVLNIIFLFTWSVNRRFDCQTCHLCFSTKDSDTSFRFVDPRFMWFCLW